MVYTVVYVGEDFVVQINKFIRHISKRLSGKLI